MNLTIRTLANCVLVLLFTSTAAAITAGSCPKMPTQSDPLCASSQKELNSPSHWPLKAMTFGKPVFANNFTLKTSSIKPTPGNAQDEVTLSKLFMLKTFTDLKMQTLANGDVRVYGVTKNNKTMVIKKGKTKICYNGKKLYTQSNVGGVIEVSEITPENAGKSVTSDSEGLRLKFYKAQQ